MDEEERKQAWLEYEEEKKGKPLINPMANIAYQNNMLQQYNIMNSIQASMMPQSMSLQFEYDNLQQLIRKDVSTYYYYIKILNIQLYMNTRVHVCTYTDKRDQIK